MKSNPGSGAAKDLSHQFRTGSHPTVKEIATESLYVIFRPHHPVDRCSHERYHIVRLRAYGRVSRDSQDEWNLLRQGISSRSQPAYQKGKKSSIDERC